MQKTMASASSRCSSSSASAIVQQQQHVAAASLPRAPARVVKASVASTLMRDMVLDRPVYASAPVETEYLYKKLEAKTKALIALEEQEAPSWPLVRVRFQCAVGLGDAWKIVGRVPELGRFTPAVAPYLKWSEGNWWTYEARVRPGVWLFKFVLRRGDGAYIWEAGQDRVLDVPETAGPEDVLEMVISDVKLPA